MVTGWVWVEEDVILNVLCSEVRLDRQGHGKDQRLCDVSGLVEVAGRNAGSSWYEIER